MEDNATRIENEVVMQEEGMAETRVREEAEGPAAKRLRVTEGPGDGPSEISLPVTVQSESAAIEPATKAVGVESEDVSVPLETSTAPLDTDVQPDIASPPAAPGNASGGAGQSKQKKRKIAMFIAYNGDKYHGMQRNPGVHTIEGELEQALFRAGAIAEGNYGDPRKIYWMRAARTDKGVSALGQVVSARIVIEPPGFIERVNSFLPNQIRLLGFKRVINSFCAKQMCDRRSYEYIMPTFAFDPNSNTDRTWLMQRGNGRSESEKVRVQGNEPRGEEVEPQARSDKKVNQGATIAEVSMAVEPSAGRDTCQGDAEVASGAKQVGADMAPEPATCTSLGVGEQAADREKKPPASVKAEGQVRAEGEGGAGVGVGVGAGAGGEPTQPAFKFDSDVRARLNSVLKKFCGTHNFHNYSARVKPEDPSCKRYMLSFEAVEVVRLEGEEYVRCRVIGQSFMLHQIRKMIGMAIAVVRKAAPEALVEKALRQDTKVNVPMAPELGLFLEECFYPAYNKRFRDSHESVGLEDVKGAVEEFKRAVIYPHIASKERSDNVMRTWLLSLNDAHYPDFKLAWAEEGKRAAAGGGST